MKNNKQSRSSKMKRSILMNLAAKTFMFRKRRKRKKQKTPKSSIIITQSDHQSKMGQILDICEKRQNEIKPQPEDESESGSKRPDINTQVHLSNFLNIFNSLITENISLTLIEMIIVFCASCIVHYILSKFSTKSYIILSFIGGLNFACLLITIAALNASKIKFNLISQNLNDQVYWLSRNEIMNVHRLMPWSFFDVEIESAIWLNQALRKIWPFVQSDLINRILFAEEYYTHKENRYLFYRLLNLKIKKLRLGRKSPEITGVYVTNRGIQNESIVLNFELTIDSDLQIEFTGNYKISFGLKKFVFCCSIQTVFTALIEKESAKFGKLTLSLLNEPNVDWCFTGVAKFLNLFCFKKIFTLTLKNTFQLPNHLKISLSTFEQLKLAAKQNIFLPNGLINIELIAANNLPKTLNSTCNCKSKHLPNSYVVLNIDGEEKRTNIIKRNLNPEYLQSFNFILKDFNDFVEISIFYYNQREKPIATRILPFSMFDDEKNGRELTLNLFNSSNNGILIVDKQSATIALRITLFKLLQKPVKTIKPRHNSIPVAILRVLIEYGTGFETIVALIKSPELRLLVRVSVGNQIQTTTVKERTGYPIWNEELYFIVFNPIIECIHIEVVDIYTAMSTALVSVLCFKVNQIIQNNLLLLSEKGMVVGHVDIPISDLMRNECLKSNQTKKLDGLVEQAYLRTDLSLHLLDLTKEITENFNQPRLTMTENKKETVK